MEKKMPKRVLPLSNEEVLQDNYFKDWTLDQLCNLWPQMRFFYANGYTDPEGLLDKIREEFNSGPYEPGMGIIAMERDYLMAVAVKSFEKN